MAKRIPHGQIPAIATTNSAPAQKGAVRTEAWEKWKLDGGSLVVYPPRKGGELIGMIRVQIIAEVPLTVARRKS